ncbi:MAG: nicotinate-nucleotide diphosphorylase (carboxylating), partial [Actinomycetota bacterium]|nr:nicotinate-nucleotide diphosphorylase (carboxylating) [Actinomycetota bacterium]
QVACETLDPVRESREAGADARRRDNMTPASIKLCGAVVHAHGERHGTRPLIEASGGITLDRVAEVAATGVDCISTSALTNGAPSLDLGLDLNLESGSRV